jgi:phosphoglycerate dehydrogenase-like enzyme
MGARPGEDLSVTLLLPAADGVADHVAARFPQATVLRYEDVTQDELAEVTFYCLPYMGDSASVKLIAGMPGLITVQSLSSGVDDVLAAVPATVTLCNGRGLHHEEGTAELAVALILASLRQIPRFVRQQADRSWQHVRTESVDGKRVLLVGAGHIGSAIAQRLAAFGARISQVSRTARAGVMPLSELPRMAAASDILVICIALSSQTRGLVDRDVLAALPDGALIVNVARGPVVDADALATELASGRLSAALDVTDVEPLPPDRPEWTLPNVLITPHVGGDTTQFAERAASFVADQVARHLTRQPLLNVVKAALT